MAVPMSRNSEINMLAPATATVGVASTVILAANAARKFVSIVNDGVNAVYISFKAANPAVVGSGTLLIANGGVLFLTPTDVRVRHQINGIVGAGTSVVTVQEGE